MNNWMRAGAIAAAAIASAVLLPRAARANAAGRIYIKYNGTQPPWMGTAAVAVDPNGNLLTRGYEVNFAGAAAFNGVKGLLIKKSGTPLYGVRAYDAQAVPFDPTKMGELVIANSDVIELNPSLPLSDPSGSALMFKNSGFVQLEFDQARNNGAIFIRQVYGRGFGYRKSAADYGYSSIEKQNFIDAVLLLTNWGYFGTACGGGTVSGLNMDGSALNYHVPGGVTHFSKYDEIHATNMTHNQPNLLPWHRRLVRRFEDELRFFDPTVSLPYWDWNVGSAMLMDPIMPGFMGTPNNYDASTNTYALNGNTSIPIGSPWDNTYYQSCDPTCSNANPPIDPCTNWAACTSNNTKPPCRTNMITAAWNTAFPVQIVTRLARYEGATFSPGRSDQELMTYADFKDFADGLNLDHDEIHQTYFGSNFDSTVGPPETAARDPFFFLIHGNVDRIWQSWQILHGGMNPSNFTADYGLYLDTPEPEPQPNTCVMGGHSTSQFMEGIQTCQEPWSDMAASHPMPGYRHVRPFTSTCTETGCLQGDPYTPYPAIDSTDSSLIVPTAMYDSYVQPPF